MLLAKRECEMTMYKCPVCKHEMKLTLEDTVSMDGENSMSGNILPNVNRLFACVNDKCPFGEANENALKKLAENNTIEESKRKEG